MTNPHADLIARLKQHVAVLEKQCGLVTNTAPFLREAIAALAAPARDLLALSERWREQSNQLAVGGQYRMHPAAREVWQTCADELDAALAARQEPT